MVDESGMNELPHGVIHTRRAPKSSTQRSREFRERNPHYHRDYRRRQEAEAAALAALRAEVKALPLLAPLFIEQRPATTLALPAPGQVSNPLVTLQLPLFADASVRAAQVA